MQKTKRILNLIALIVFLMSNFLTPISYATSDLSISGVEGNESDGYYVGTEQGTQDFLASTSEGQTGEALEGQEDEQNDDSVSSGTEGNGSEEFSNDSETPIDSSSNPKNDDNDGNIEEPEPRDEVIENSSLDLLKDTIDNISTNPDDDTEPTQIPENNEYEESEIGDVMKNSENDIPESENDETVGIESEEIYGTGEYEGVKVEVYAQAGLFDKGTELTIEPVIEEKLEQVKEVLSGEVEMVDDKEDQTVIAFDITFRNPETQEEIQPKNGTVQVTFNYEENENLKQAEEDEEQEIKVYHLNDKDEEGEKIEEITGSKVEEIIINKEGTEENKIVVEVDNFSIYVVGNISLKSLNEGDLVEITYNTNGGIFGDGGNQKSIQYIFHAPVGGPEYSHTPNISDDGVQNGNYDNNLNTNAHVVSIPGAKKLKITIKHGTESTSCDWVSMWLGSHPNYKAGNNYSSSIIGTGGRLGGTTSTLTTNVYIVDGDTVTFSFKSDSSVNYYGYYAIIEDIGRYSTDETMENPTKEGYGFVGWAEEGSTELYDISQGLPSNNTLYAVRKENKNIKYNANGGYFKIGDTTTDEVDVGYLVQENFEYEPIMNLQFPNRITEDIEEQSGWMFAGWYTTEGEASTQTTEWLGQVTDSTENNMVVYAKWLPFNDISIMDGEQVGFTIMDRNLGAESISYGNDLDGMGYYYQWGNNYGFSSNSGAIIKTSSERVDVSGYGPDNYYSSNIFIRNSSLWDSSNNKNLWGGTGDSLKTRGEGTDEDRQGPCPDGYHIPSTLEWKFAYNVWYNSNERSTDEDSDLKNFIKDFKLPFAGYRNYNDGNVSSQGTYGYYQSSSPVPNSTNAYSLYLYNGGNFNAQSSSYPSYGRSIRCFKNSSGTKKIQYFTETGEKITEYTLDWWDSIPDIDNHHDERTGYEYLGWFESGSNEGFDFTEDVARSVSLYEKWIDIEGIAEADTAKLLNGKKFNSAIKTLASGAVISYDEFDNQIKGIERSETLPEGINKKLISSNDSETPIFAWYDTESQKIKYYTKAREVYMNEDSSYMYSKLKNLSSINLEEFKADYVENMDWMFYYSCSSVDGLNLDFRNLNLSNVTSMTNMFNSFLYQGSGANNININFSKMDLSNVKNVNQMFYYSFAYAQNVSGVTIDFSEADMRSVTNMGYMFEYSFEYAKSVNGVEINFSEADMRSVTNMGYMFGYSFEYAKSVNGVEINFSEANISSVTNMNSMFYHFGYSSSQEGADISGVTVNFSKADMRSVTNMYYMFGYSFEYAKSVDGVEINFSEANISSVTNMDSMFYYFGYSSSQEGADISGVTVNFSKADMSSVTNMYYMFEYSFAYAQNVSGVTIDFSEADMSSEVNMGSETSMYYMFAYSFEYANSVTGVEINFSEADISSVTNMSYMFYYFCYGSTQKGTNISGVTVNLSKLDMSSVTAMNNMFYYGFAYAKSIDGVEINFSEANMSSVTNMSYMFYDFGYSSSQEGADISGVTVNFSKADMRSVTNMGYMFEYSFAYAQNVSGVTIDFSEADMSSVQSMYYMFGYSFEYAKSVDGVEINFSEADISSVTNMSYMFYDFCYGSTKGTNISGVTVNFSKADMSSVTNMYYMFAYSFAYAQNVSGVTIDFSEADMRSVTNMQSMFYYSFAYTKDSITGVEIKWNNSKFTNSLTNMQSMFYYTYGITGLDLSSFDTSNVTNMSYMFNNTKDLKTIYVGSKFRTNNVTSSSSMFYNATSLVGGRGTTYNSSNPNDKTYARVDRIGEPGYFTQKGGSSVATATLLPGQEFNAKIKTISKGSSASYSDADTYIKKIKKGTEEQALARISGGGTLEKISTTTSDVPVFARYNNSDKTLYYYSEANEIDMNANAYGMFYNLTKLEEVELNGINTSSVTSMGLMFKYDTSLTGLDLSSFDTSNVTYMANMFEGCSNLKTLILDGWNLSKSPSISTMFYNATSLEKVSMRGWKLPTSFIHMLGCRTSQLCATTLQELDVTNWDLSQTTDISGLFGQSNTRQIIGLDTWNTSNIENMSNMFGLCPNLTGLNLDNWNLSRLNITSSNSSAIGGMYSGTPNLKTLSMKNWVLPVSAYQLAGGWSNSLSAELDWIDVSGWDLSKTTDLNGLFGGNQTKKIIGMDTWDTSNVQNMNNMFKGCSKLTELNLSNFDTSNVTNMSAIFYGNSSLTELNLSGWNTNKVTNMSTMFYGNNKLRTLDVSHFNTSNVTSMANMFEGCSKLKTLDLSNFNTSKVSNMQGMFKNCTNLTELNLSNFSTSATTNMKSMFEGCNKVTKLDLSNFNTSQVSDMSSMFQNCASLKELNISSWDTNNVINMAGMLKNCSSLTGLDLSNFNTSQVSDMSSMFQNCASLKELNISSWDTNNVTNMTSMFDGDSKLKTVYASNKFVTNKASNSTMFQDTYEIRGGKGTTYNISELGTKYARIDEKGLPGYFTDILDVEYPITYDTNGGIITGEKVTYTAKESFDLVVPTKQGYNFIGWAGSNGNDPKIQVTIQTGTTGDLYFIANWVINNYKIIFDTNGGNDISFIEREYNASLTDIQLPTPTKDGQIFLGWNRTLPARMPGEDITLVAQWKSESKESSSSGGGGGGGGGSSAIDVVKESIDNNTDTHNAAEGKDEKDEKEGKDIVEEKETSVNGNTTENNMEAELSHETLESTYSPEFIEAYNFAKTNGITTQTNIQKAKIDSPLTRIAMAKMLSYYAINILGQEPDISKTISFDDVSDKRDAEYDNGVTLAYQLGIMGQNMKNNKFRPNDEVTRAEFVTALSRMIYGMSDGKGEQKYYEPHMARLYNEGIINNTDPKMKEKRGYVMIMLMRTIK